MIYEIKNIINNDVNNWYLIKYEDKFFKVNNYNEFLNVFYTGSKEDNMLEKEKFLYGLIKIVALVNNLEIIICNEYYTNKVKKNNFILHKNDINSLIYIINVLEIALIFRIIET